MTLQSWSRFVLLLFLPFPLAQCETFRKGQSVVVVSDQVVLRVGPKTVGTARRGDVLSVVEIKDDWVGVVFRGRKGWVRSQHLGPAPKPEQRPTPRREERELTFAGYFTEGGKRKRHDLRCVFKKTGPDRWDAAFHFVWGNKKQLFRGTVTGNLRNGSVNGRARSGSRTWVFEGTARNRTLRCKHFETTRGRRRPTGDFLIRR